MKALEFKSLYENTVIFKLQGSGILPSVFMAMLIYFIINKDYVKTFDEKIIDVYYLYLLSAGHYADLIAKINPPSQCSVIAGLYFKKYKGMSQKLLEYIDVYDLTKMDMTSL